MKRTLSVIGLSSLVVLTACSRFTSTSNGGEQQSSVTSSSESVSSTEPAGDSVSMEGTLQRAGISIYMEGTHRLYLEDGSFILLESSGLQLEGYVGKRVSISGILRPTVEAGGKIMTVEDIEVLAEVESSSESSIALSSSSSSVASSEASSAPAASSASSAKQSSSAAAKHSSSSAAKSSATAASSSTATSDGATVGSHTSVMVKDKFDASIWTQQYCSSHIGFCIPVHKNWWYKSFGASTSTLWHVELSSEEILQVGDGPIKVDLVSGENAVADNTVSVQSGTVTGYRSWTQSRHFEISGPVELQGAIEFITKNLATYEETTP